MTRRQTYRLPGAALAGTLALSAPVPATAQDAVIDGWDFGRDPTRNLTIAAVSFENFGVAVRCLDDVLSVVVSGVPKGRGIRTFKYQMGDQIETDSRWVAFGDGGTAFAVWPARTAAGLARGGRLNLGIRDGDNLRRVSVDLPPSTTSVSQVFQACGRELEPTTEESEPGAENLAGLRWINSPDASFPTRSAAEAGIAAVSCTADAGGRLRRCRIESEFPEGGGFGRAATLGAHRTGRVGPEEGASVDMDGRKVAFVVNYRMADEYTFTIPTRIPRAPDPGDAATRDED